MMMFRVPQPKIIWRMRASACRRPQQRSAPAAIASFRNDSALAFCRPLAHPHADVDAVPLIGGRVLRPSGPGSAVLRAHRNDHHCPPA